MPYANVNGLELCYDTLGDADGRPLLLVMGLVTQLIGWPDAFCRQLAEQGHYVVRFDHRDVGLSTKMDALGIPDLEHVAAAAARGERLPIPYSLLDMLDDALGLADLLGLERFHVCGLSMGGMIAQLASLHCPERILSMVSMQSGTGEPDLPPPTEAAAEALLSSPPVEREPYIEYSVGVYRAFAGGSNALDDATQRQLSGAAYDRCFYPEGFTRQMAAILAAPGRRQSLAAVHCPTLVIHGTHDALLPPAHAVDLAGAIPDADLMMIEGLGHGMAYPALWPQMVNAIARHTRLATGAKEP